MHKFFTQLIFRNSKHTQHNKKKRETKRKKRRIYERQQHWQSAATVVIKKFVWQSRLIFFVLLSGLSLSSFFSGNADDHFHVMLLVLLLLHFLYNCNFTSLHTNEIFSMDLRLSMKIFFLSRTTLTKVESKRGTNELYVSERKGALV